jgi:hypothetical protein
MIRCVRLWTGPEGSSHFRDGRLDIESGRNDDLVSSAMTATHVTVEETAGGDRWPGIRRRYARFAAGAAQ